MHVLFVHQNFPAQFRYIAPRLVRDYGYRCTFVTERSEGELPGVEKVLYKPRGGATMANHVCTRNFENTVAHSHGVFESLKAHRDLNPDLIVAHTGFGSSLFLPFLWNAPVINFLEFFYHPVGQDLGFRPEVPVDEFNLLRSRTNNAMILLDLVNCDRGWTPTHYQRAFFPTELQSKIEVIFDGIDTDIYFRKVDADARIRAQLQIPVHHRIVTYVARGFEMMRGFDIFMKAAKRIYEQFTDVTFVVVGTDKVHYGGDLKFIKEKSFRHHVLADGGYDLSRFRFTGYVQQDVLADILSVGDVHIYLTEPFIASWSMVNAMACGSVLLASDQTCVREYIEPGRNGLLVNFFDDEALARQAVEILKDPPTYRHLGEAAIQTVREKYSLDIAMSRVKELFERVARSRREPGVLLEALLKAGTLPSNPNDPDVPPPAEKTAMEPGGSATDMPASDADAVGSELDPASELAQAVKELRRISTGSQDPLGWVRMSQSYRGPAGPLQTLGPANHPIDLARMGQRVFQWRPETIVDVGAVEGGTVFLWTRVAAPTARIVVAPVPGRVASQQMLALLNYMAREQQSIRCLPLTEDPNDLEKAVDQALEGRMIDVLFLHGRRPYKELSADFRRYRKKVRPGGLIGWDGIDLIGKNPANEGGDRLWQEVKPLYPQRAEYLNGAANELGGIAMIKI